MKIARNITAQEALDDIEKLIMSGGFEEEIFPRITAYVDWLEGCDFKGHSLDFERDILRKEVEPILGRKLPR